MKGFIGVALSLVPEIARARGQTDLARVVLDYVAGMTDRFAIQEHARLFQGSPQP